MEKNIYSEFLLHCRDQGVPVMPPARSEDVIQTFRELGQPLSNDVLTLYTSFGGFVDFEIENLWSLWSLNRLKQENQAYEPPLCWFADYLVSSHMYALQYCNAEVSAVYVDHNSVNDPPYKIADSVEQFFKMYLRDPGSVEAWR